MFTCSETCSILKGQSLLSTMNRYVFSVFTCSFTCPILFFCYSIKIFLIDFQSLTYFLVKKFVQGIVY